MAKKTSPPRVEVTFRPEDWTALLPGQPVRVRLLSGATFTAVIETKTGNSSAVWIVRDDNLKTRQVFGHTEGIQLVPIGQAADSQDRIGETPELGQPPDVYGVNLARLFDGVDT